VVAEQQQQNRLGLVETYRDHEFRYSVDAEQLPDHARGFRPSSLGPEGRAFVDRCLQSRHGATKTRLHRLLGHLLSDFDVNGLLGMYPMHLLDSAQFAELTGTNLDRLLDVGAGNGDVTNALRPLAREVHVTEQSWAMRRVLGRRGFQVLGDALPDPSPGYDLVSCLNVLDRTDRPVTLLRELSMGVAPRGKLLLSVPLPIDPFFFDGARTRMPAETLPSGVGSWERSWLALAKWLGRTLPGWTTTCFTRAPYLSGGDARRTLYVLDAVVTALERTPTDESKNPDQSVEPRTGAP
jgi:SAM-dependent methyltransferase